MSWLARFVGKGTPLDAAQRAALSAYRSMPPPDLSGPLAAGRLLVVDVETSGFDPVRDRLISIGAVTVAGGLARFDRSFEAVLKQEQPSDHGNILVHGIGGSAQLSGREPAVALLDFLLFAGKAPLVCFNVPFDRAFIERATSPLLGITPENAWLELAVLVPAIFPGRGASTLDEWVSVFGIENYARHDALADALATAQLLLVALAEAGKHGVRSCADLMALEKSRRWLG